VEPHRYSVSGCVLVSDVPLALPQPAPVRRGQEPDATKAHCIRVRFGSVTLPPEPFQWDVQRPGLREDEPWLSVVRVAGAHVLRVHGCADFGVNASADDVVCDVEEGITPEVLEHVLLDGILPQLLHLVGFTSFHASAIADPSGRVVALMGASGSGKSTLAGSLADASAPTANQDAMALVGDDTLSLSVQDDHVKVYSSYPRVRLWADSAGALFDAPGSDEEEAKSHIAVRPCNASELELVHVFALVPDAAELFVEPLRRRDAIVELAKHLDRLLPHDREQLRKEFDTLEALTNLVPVSRLGVPHDYGRLAEVRSMLAGHLRRR